MKNMSKQLQLDLQFGSYIQVRSKSTCELLADKQRKFLASLTDEERKEKLRKLSEGRDAYYAHQKSLPDNEKSHKRYRNELRGNLVGKAFGTLTIQAKVDTGDKQNRHWECICLCGKQVIKSTQNLHDKSKCPSCLHKGINRSVPHPKARKRPFEVLFTGINSDYEDTLTYEEFVEFTKTKSCYYCNTEVSWIPHLTPYTKVAYNLDRKNSLLGYSKENCVVCCGSCNKIKNKFFDDKEFLVIMTAFLNFKKLREEEKEQAILEILSKREK